MATNVGTAIPTFWVGGGPSSLVLELETDVTVDAVTSVSSALYGPDGEEVAGVTASLTASTVTVHLPPDPFTMGGFYTLVIVLQAPTFSEVVEPVLIVVQAADGWLTLEQARAMWPQAPDEDDQLFMLLESAKDACANYLKGPLETVEEWYARGVLIKVPWRQGQFQQARALWLAMSATVDSTVGDDEFHITVFPLDWNVKQLLRPKALPAMF